MDALATARQLEKRDADLAAEAARLRALAEEAAAVGRDAASIETLFSAYPAEETARRRATAEAHEELNRRRGQAVRAADEVEHAKGDEQRAAAEAALRRAADHVAVAEARVLRAREAEAELERDAASRQSEIPRLEERARRVSRELAELPSEPVAPRELVEWASRARALLFVRLSRLDAQRESVIREANELGTLTLGDPTYGCTPTQVRRRIEATIAG